MQDWEDWELDWKIGRLESQRMSSMMERIKARKKREKLLEKYPSKKKSFDPTYFYCFINCFCVIKIRDIKAVEQSLIPTIIPIIEFTSIADNMIHFKMLQHILKAFYLGRYDLIGRIIFYNSHDRVI